MGVWVFDEEGVLGNVENGFMSFEEIKVNN